MTMLETVKNGVKREPRVTTFSILLAILVAAVVAWYFRSWLALAFFVGGIGGILHELIQSGGKFFLPQPGEKEYYLGSFVGFFLGGVAGLIVLKGHLAAPPPAGTDLSSGGLFQYELALESLLAGIALKGVSEAATDRGAKTGDAEG